jgi:endonuclease/exonuclease/phosphatase family metal-dependent hydrolase
VTSPLAARFRVLLVVLLAVALTGCAGSHNYVEPGGPRYAACYAATPDTTEIRVVTFNIKYGEEIDKAIDLLQTTPGLLGADILMLQELDPPGVHQIAFALGMCYIYYPATLRSNTGRDFGNAILSRWPIRNDRKIILPHNGRFGKTQRIAVTGTVTIRGHDVQLYSVHLATWIEVSFHHREDQARAIVEDARNGPELVIVGGDMNSHDVGEVFAKNGFAWPTRTLGSTAVNGKLDHIFLRGLSLMDSTSIGIVHDNKGASDHRPVWAVVKPPNYRPAQQ